MSVLENLLHLFAPLTANCSDFKEKWAKAAEKPAGGIGGCWQGEWISAVSGHHGPLRCVVEPIDEDQWRMSFRAEYGKIFRACYATDFAVAADGDRWTFSGGSNLGALAGGVYEYGGWASLESLTCTYKSATDHGEFRLKKRTPDRLAVGS